MPSSAEEFDAAIDRAADAVTDAFRALPPGGPAPIVLIDGRSGAGKTTLARRLAERWGGNVRVIGLDELYPGWDGLADGAELARAQILEPIVRGESARWRRWDWQQAARGDEVETPAGAALIVEGSGVLTAASAPLAPIRVWLESPEGARRARALARDGDMYRPHWRRWAAQEDRHELVDAPRARATIVAEIP